MEFERFGMYRGFNGLTEYRLAVGYMSRGRAATARCSAHPSSAACVLPTHAGIAGLLSGGSGPAVKPAPLLAVRLDPAHSDSLTEISHSRTLCFLTDAVHRRRAK